nr:MULTISPECIES: hypothetical protein [Providencia]
MKYKVGDKVRVVKDILGSNLVGYECEVTSIDNSETLNIGVNFPDGIETYFAQGELELINETSSSNDDVSFNWWRYVSNSITKTICISSGKASANVRSRVRWFNYSMWIY